VAGRTHRAKPGEAACGVDGCERPAGFATDNPGAGPCLRHSNGSARIRPATPTRRGPAEPVSGLEKRLRGPGRPTPDPLALVRVLMLGARRAGFSFEEAWNLATATALAYMSDGRAEDWWDVLTSTRRAWADAYTDARSPLSLMPREVPQAAGFAMPGGPRRRRAISI
jgi:hypothetical protein